MIRIKNVLILWFTLIMLYLLKGVIKLVESYSV